MKYVTFDANGVLDERLIEGLHDIPAHAVSVDDELWRRLVTEADGVWYLEDGDISKRALPELPPDYESAERKWRDTELQSTEWLVARHRDELDLPRDTTLLAPQYVELLVYRQALRDWPAAGAFPESADRPVAPPWITPQSS